MGSKQKTAINADCRAVNKSVNEYWTEPLERDAAMPSPQQEHTCWSWTAHSDPHGKSEGEPAPEVDFYSFSWFHYSLKVMLHRTNQLSTKKCENLHQQQVFPRNSVFSCFIHLSLETYSYVPYDHFLHTFKIHPLFSSHSAMIFIQVLTFIYIYAYIYTHTYIYTFTFVPSFVITPIVFPWDNIKANLGDAPCASKMFQGHFPHNRVFLLTLFRSLQKPCLFSSSNTHNSAA